MREHVEDAALHRYVRGGSERCEVEEHSVEDVDGPTAYYAEPSGCSISYSPAPEWLVEYWRRRDESRRIQAGMMFFVSVAAAIEEDVEQKAAHQDAKVTR